MTYSVEVEIDYETNLYPYVATATVLVEYQETEEGKEIEGVYVSEFVPKYLIESITETARAQFHNL